MPTRTGKFKPEPLESVATEDPALSMGRDKVVMWSYPIVDDGLSYVADIRNGLYIRRYTGEQVDEIDFLEATPTSVTRCGSNPAHHPGREADGLKHAPAVLARHLPAGTAGAVLS